MTAFTPRQLALLTGLEPHALTFAPDPPLPGIRCPECDWEPDERPGGWQRHKARLAFHRIHEHDVSVDAAFRWRGWDL